MREQIAVLDGIHGLGMADPYAQDYSGFDGPREYTPVPGGGQNRTGGSDWASSFPYKLQQEGLANISSLGMDSADSYAGSDYTPVPGGGALYSGGSNWHPRTPTLPSSEGLASTLGIEEVPGWAGNAYTPVPGGGANYTGGSNWKTEFPTKIPSEGLVGYRGRGLRGLGDVAMMSRGAACGIMTALRLTGRSMTKSQIQVMMRIVMQQLPLNVARTPKAASYFGALQIARSSGLSMAAARDIARRAMQMCG